MIRRLLGGFLNVAVEIYPNIFVVAENSKGREERHALMYTDVWISLIEILELKKSNRESREIKIKFPPDQKMHVIAFYE